jgi:two-component system cell cycle response regulator
MKTITGALLGVQASSVGIAFFASHAIAAPVLGMICFLTCLGLLWKWSQEEVVRQVEVKVKAQNTELLEKMAHYELAAATDALTGLMNRRGGENALGHHVARSKRLKTAFSIIFVDIDHFKSINDKFGHSIGDQVLSAIARILSDNIRATDFGIRWGGEEFLVCLPDTDLKGAIIVAEKLRKTIQRVDMEVTGLSITASFGCAEVGEDEISIAIARADMNLYMAKTKGRNLVFPKFDEKGLTLS